MSEREREREEGKKKTKRGMKVGWGEGREGRQTDRSLDSPSHFYLKKLFYKSGPFW